MCGLAGFWNFQCHTPAESLMHIGARMGAALQHRGPDSSGIWCDESANLVLTHQRLSIIDLQGGHQPMHSSSRRFVLIYNGEIYNAAILRKELIQYQFAFHTVSDTEVVIAACEYWGVEQAVRRFIGMFAFALWDCQQRELYLVRDRLGIKPLYWGFHRGILFFGSELKSFFSHPAWQPQLNEAALPEYFRYGYIPAPKSIYRDIEKLSPGSLIVINHHGEVRSQIYWQLSHFISASQDRKKNKISSAQNITLFDQLLRDAVQCRMLADVPLGAFLSGGIDSSLTVALMQTQSGTPIKTFTIGFSEEEYNEAKYARAIAKYLGTEHHEWILSSGDALNIIPKLPICYDEPFADSSQIPTYLLSAFARRAVTVALSGDGGDEGFAGYTRYLVLQKLAYFLKMPLPARQILSHLLQYVPNKIIPHYFHQKFSKLIRLLQTTSSTHYLSLVSLWQDPHQILERRQDEFLWHMPNHLVEIEQAQYIDTLTYLPDDILTKVDRASMFNSLEVRVPLIDHRVIEHAWQLPVSMKVRGKQSKWILREILSQYVPRALFERPKMGFGVPIDFWLRGPLRDWAETLLMRERFNDHGLLKRELIHKYWQAYLQGQGQYHYLLWAVLMFQAWYQQWIRKY